MLLICPLISAAAFFEIGMRPAEIDWFQILQMLSIKMEIKRMNLRETSFGINRDFVGENQTFYKLKGAGRTQLRKINGHSVREHVVIEKGQMNRWHRDSVGWLQSTQDKSF